LQLNVAATTYDLLWCMKNEKICDWTDDGQYQTLMSPAAALARCYTYNIHRVKLKSAL